MFPSSATANVLFRRSFVMRASSSRKISSQTARSLLGLQSADVSLDLSLMDLRLAYFRKAKECHPDLRSSLQSSLPSQDDEDKTSSAHHDFLQVTTAYEILQQELTAASRSDANDIEIITFTEEQAFRVACEEQLGLSADIVEECKTNGMFREWLTGNTDSAHTWRNFFMQHGGLAPRLRHAAEAIAAGNASGAASRRKRK